MHHPAARSRLATMYSAMIWATLMVAQPVLAADAASTAGTEACLACHGNTAESIKFGNGSRKSVKVDRKMWSDSVHGGKLACTDCHREITGFPHKKVKAEDAREYTLQRANTCQRCHYAHYTRVLDSIHYEMLQQGVREAPVCVDCHGSHGIKNPKSPRIEINRKCGNCHSDVGETFRKSVHGKALEEENNQDVPVCTDCHGAHAVSGPNKANFHESSYKTCANCHSDAEKMKKYGLNPDVLDTYLDDFHGSSNRLYAMGAGKPDKPIASCSDCHGVHDIQSFKAAAAKAANPKQAVREQVVKACQKCHAGVTPSFADAWLSHYKPTLQSAPLVWAVKWFYRFVIPFILLGLVLHILLHLWRLKTHR